MTREETAQVQNYIAGLQVTHAKELAKENSRTLIVRQVAYKERDAANTAIMQIWNLCHTQSQLTPPELAVTVRQIIDYYVPDWDIPF